MLPDHSAIAWNVQHVQAEASGHPWKLHVMPENVFYGRPKFLRDRHQSHVVAGEVEQVQVVFKHEQGELVLLRIGQKRFDKRKDVLSDACFAMLDHRSGKADFHRPAFRAVKDGN